MESQNQEEGPRRKETILPPQIIRPLARAINQKIGTSLDSLRQLLNPVQKEGLDLFTQGLEKLEKAKVVKLVEDPPADPDDFPAFGIELSEEMDTEVSIPPSTTNIEEPYMPNLGMALQDYLMNPINSVRGSEDINSKIMPVVYFLRNLTRQPKIVITNTENGQSIINQ